jgi:hypothetical protein
LDLPSAADFFGVVFGEGFFLVNVGSIQAGGLTS